MLNWPELIASQSYKDALDEIRDRAAECDEAGKFPSQNMELLHRAGLLALGVRRDHSGHGAGPGGDIPLFAKVIEDVSAACSSTGQALAVHAVACCTINLLGSEDQIRRFSREVVEEGRIYGFFGSEPAQRFTKEGERDGYDSEVKRVEGGWIANGRKFFSTNSMGAHRFLFFSMSTAEGEPKLAVPIILKASEGVTVHDSWDNMGQRGTASGIVDVKDVMVSDADMLGPPGLFGTASPVLLSVFQLTFAAELAGIARGALDFTIDYLKTRTKAPAGLPSLGHDPHVQSRLGEMSVAVEATSAMVRRAAELVGRADKDSAYAALAHRAVLQAKILASQQSIEMGTMVFQICGARATTRSVRADRFWRNARTLSLHDIIDKQRAAVGRDVIGLEPDTGHILTALAQRIKVEGAA